MRPLLTIVLACLGWLGQSTRRHVAFVVLALACAPLTAFAQDQLRASAALSRASVELGDTIVLQVAVDGASEATTPTIPDSADYTIEFLGSQDESRRTSFVINGRASESNVLRYVMQWQITPRREGQMAIEAFTVTSGGRELKVPRTAFTVTRPTVNTNFKLELLCDTKQAYVGEPIRAKLVWTLGATVKSATFTGPDGGAAFDVEAMDPRPLKVRANQIQNNDPWRIVPFLNGQAVVTRSQGTFDGRTVPIFTLDIVITPRTHGPVTIGPYRVACDEVTGQKSRSFFDSPFDDLSQTRRAVIESNPLSLTVKQLPEEGKPAEFAGLIGRFSIDARAAHAEANVGDPIPLTITINGPEPLSNLRPPDLEAQADFNALFRAAPEGWEAADASKTAGAAPGSRTFTTTVRPKSDSITQIPPIRLPYFDTATGKYDVAQSKPIALKVRTSRQVTAADAQTGAVGSPPPTVGATAFTLTNAPAGVGANYESLDALDDQRLTLIGWAKSLPGVLVLGGPPVAFAGAMMTAFWRKRLDPVAVVRRRELSVARGLLSQANDHRTLSAAIRTAIAPWAGVSRDAVTAQDASRLPRDCGPHAAALLSLLESAAYDGRPVDVAAARTNGQELMDRLARQ